MNDGGVIYNYNDPAFDALIDPDREYDLKYHVNGLVEKQSMWAIEVPLLAQFEHKFGGKNGIYAGLGVKGYFPFTAKSRFPGEVDITTVGYESFVDNHGVNQYHELQGRFGTGHVRSNYRSDKVNKMRCSFDLQAEFGGIFQLNKKLDLYVGLYGSYGFLNILPKVEKQIEFIVPPITPNPDNATTDIYYNLPSLLASDILVDYNNYIKENNKDWKETKNKWNLWQVGLKVGIHIKACNNGDADEPTMRELKRKYYEEMAKKANDPIIIKNTEYIYIVPTCPEGYQDDEELTPEDKNNIAELAKALSNTKILFDLDKDIPKYTEQNDNMRKVSEIMKKDKTLNLVIEGYTCDLGSETHNQDLAQRRAIAVKNDFVNKFGVNPDQISIAAYTAKTPENINNIPDKSREEHRAAIFRIVKN
jgi:outer membrane protein OmpA-like peptidoglycan-associated protein